MDNNKIGNFIATLRKEKGLTQQELGNRLFVTDKAVSKWERGLSLPDITLLQELASILDVDVSEIICGERGKKEKINIQDEIDKAINKIKQNDMDRKRNLKNKIRKILVLSFSILLIVSLFLIIRFKYYHPSIIKEGSNRYEIGFMGISVLEKDGLDEFVKILSKTEKVKDYKYNIPYLSIGLRKNGTIKNVTMSIKFFDNDYNYVGDGYYIYNNKNLQFGYERG